MNFLGEPLDAGNANALATLIAQFEYKFDSISGIADPLRKRMGQLGSFTVNRENLSALVPSEKSIGLDTLFETSEDLAKTTILDSALYFESLRADPKLNSLDSDAALATVVDFIAQVNKSALKEWLELAPETAVYEDLETAPNQTYEILAKSRRFTLTASNINTYLKAQGKIDEALCLFLAHRKNISPGTDLETVKTIAVEILNCSDLSTDDKISLTDSLNFQSHLRLDELSLELNDGRLFAHLIQKNLSPTTRARLDP